MNAETTTPVAAERDPENELQTLLDLLSLPWDVRPAIGQLATAIETHGIAGYDEYGRECKAKKGNRTSALALKALRDYYAAGIAYEMDGGEAQGLEHPDEYWLDQWRSPLVEYGWLKTAVPDFGARPQEKPHRKPPEPRDRTLQIVITALCKADMGIDIRDGDRADEGVAKRIDRLVYLIGEKLNKNTLTTILKSCREYSKAAGGCREFPNLGNRLNGRQ